jgi:hypothetical protein
MLAERCCVHYKNVMKFSVHGFRSALSEPAQWKLPAVNLLELTLLSRRLGSMSPRVTGLSAQMQQKITLV